MWILVQCHFRNFTNRSHICVYDPISIPTFHHCLHLFVTCFPDLEKCRDTVWFEETELNCVMYQILFSEMKFWRSFCGFYYGYRQPNKSSVSFIIFSQQKAFLHRAILFFIKFREKWRSSSRLLIWLKMGGFDYDDVAEGEGCKSPSQNKHF